MFFGTQSVRTINISQQNGATMKQWRRTRPSFRKHPASNSGQSFLHPSTNTKPVTVIPTCVVDNVLIITMDRRAICDGGHVFLVTPPMH